MLLLDYDPNMYTAFGFIGITSALVFCNMGAAYGTGKAGIGICQVGITRPDMVFKSLIPIIMAGILGIYGLIVAVILQGRGKLNQFNHFLVTYTQYNSIYPDFTTTPVTPAVWSYSAYAGYKHLASGLCCGLSSLAAGLAIGIAGDAGVRANAQKDIYVGVILILIFAEALGLYGLIISIILGSVSTNYLV